MGEMGKRLASCFSAVLPELSVAEILHASVDTVPSWDSVATVNLIMVIENEFGIEIDIYDPSQFDSFQGILNYLRRGRHSTSQSAYKSAFTNVLGSGAAG